MLPLLWTLASLSAATKCGTLQDLYQNTALGASCCQDPSQPWCAPLENLDVEGLKDVVRAAPDFDSAMTALEQVFTVYAGVSPPLRIRYYNPPLPLFIYDGSILGTPFEDIEYDQLDHAVLRKLASFLICEELTITCGLNSFGGWGPAGTVFTVMMTNFEEGGSDYTVATSVVIGLDGRVQDFRLFPERNASTAQFSQLEFYGAYTTQTPMPQGNENLAPMTQLQPKIRAMLNDSRTSVGDPFVAEDAIVYEFSIFANGGLLTNGALAGNYTRLISFQSSHVLGILFAIATSKAPNTGSATDADILAVDIAPTPPVVLKATQSREQLKGWLDGLRAMTGFSPTVW